MVLANDGLLGNSVSMLGHECENRSSSWKEGTAPWNTRPTHHSSDIKSNVDRIKTLSLLWLFVCAIYRKNTPVPQMDCSHFSWQGAGLILHSVAAYNDWSNLWEKSPWLDKNCAHFTGIGWICNRCCDCDITSTTYRTVAVAGWLGGGQRHGEKMSLSGEDVVVNINGKLAFLRKEQVEVFEHLSQKERVHPKHQHINIHIQRRCFTAEQRGFSRVNTLNSV